MNDKKYHALVVHLLTKVDYELGVIAKDCKDEDFDELRKLQTETTNLRTKIEQRLEWVRSRKPS
jgi:hypothetical protein